MKPDNERSASAWLGVAITSMIFMGAHAFMIALSRTPGFNLLFSDQNFFRTALVTHVVLSVVIWFLAYILFVVYYVTAQEPVGGVDYLPPIFALAGIALIVLTPFTGPGSPLLNNYVPVLQRGLYFAGLFVFLLSATAGMAIRAPALARTAVSGSGHPMIVTLSLAGAGVALAFGVGCIFLSWLDLRGASDLQRATFYYEALFWGGGHVFQFANTMGLMANWEKLQTTLLKMGL